jgi:hypothetical protein
MPYVPRLPIGVEAPEVQMRQRVFLTVVAALVATVGVLTAASLQQKTVPLPQPGVPQIMTIEGDFIRAAYNNEGYVILGYRVANQSQGEEWMLLEVGATMREGKPNYTLPRSALSISTPDNAKIPMATNEEFLQVNLMAVQNRLKVQHDSIDYYPPTVNRVQRMGFFSELDTRTRAYDQVELSDQRAASGRIFFKVPGGIKLGQHFLNVQFKESLIRVPFRILTAEEEKFLRKNYRDIRKQVQETFTKKK